MSILQKSNQLKKMTLATSLTCFHQIGFEKIFTTNHSSSKGSQLLSSSSSSLEEFVVNIRYYFSPESDGDDDYDTHKERIMLYEDLSILVPLLKKLELSFLGFSLISFKSHIEDLQKCFSSLLARCNLLEHIKLHYLYTNINNCKHEKTLALGNLFKLLSYNSFQNLKSFHIVEFKGLTLGHFSSSILNLSCLTKIQIDHVIQEEDQDLHTLMNVKS
jgi:hypothetical protein